MHQTHSQQINSVVSRYSRNQRGGTLVLVTFMVVAIFGFAALSLDVGNVLREQRKANYGTDAGALAGVNFLTNTVQNTGSATARALAIAQVNGVTSTEIANAGTIEVGYWTISNRTFSVTGSGPYNAIRVPARRLVPMSFARVVGQGEMNPVVHSVAAVGGAGNASVIPFGIGQNLLVGKDFVTNNTVDVNSQSAGNWGKLDLGGNNSCGPCFDNAMIDAANGGGFPTTVGEWYSPGTGSAHLVSGFGSVIGKIVIVPVIESFGNGNADVKIIGYVLAMPLSASGGGQNINITFRLIQGYTGSGIGGPGNGPYALSRALVQ